MKTYILCVDIKIFMFSVSSQAALFAIDLLCGKSYAPTPLFVRLNQMFYYEFGHLDQGYLNYIDRAVMFTFLVIILKRVPLSFAVF